MKTFLIVGLDAAAIDLSGPNTPKGMTADKLTAEIAVTQRQFAEHGDRADICAVKLEPSAAQQVANQLTQSTYDCVMIGGGLRSDAATDTLERIVSVIRSRAPGAAIAFLNLPRDGLPAAARVSAPEFPFGGKITDH